MNLHQMHESYAVSPGLLENTNRKSGSPRGCQKAARFQSPQHFRPRRPRDPHTAPGDQIPNCVNAQATIANCATLISIPAMCSRRNSRIDALASGIEPRSASMRGMMNQPRRAKASAPMSAAPSAKTNLPDQT